MNIDLDNDNKDKKLIIFLFKPYTKLWSEGNFEHLASDIYDLPMTLYLQDTVHYLKSPDKMNNFLTNTYNNLEANHYGFSTNNKWKKLQRRLKIYYR